MYHPFLYNKIKATQKKPNQQRNNTYPIGINILHGSIANVYLLLTMLILSQIQPFVKHLQLYT